SSHQTTAPNPSANIFVPNAQGRYVRVQLSGADYLSLAEVQVLGTIGGGGPGVPDLTIAKTHSGNFIQGQIGSYTITVTNNGTAATSGTVTVTEMPPASGLTITAMSGTNWGCTQPAGP